MNKNKKIIIGILIVLIIVIGIVVAYKIIELIFASKAEHVSFTFQDLLFKGKESRMNRPSTLQDENWSYRFLSFEFNNDLKNKIFSLNKKYNRFNIKNDKN